MSAQTEKEMLDAGIKKSAVKVILKKFDGDIVLAINTWAESGNGKLSKKFVVHAEKLGLNPDFLQERLKQARKVRATAIAAGLSGLAQGYSQSIQAQNNQSNSTQSSYTTPSYTTPSYSLPTYTTPANSQIYNSQSYDYYGTNEWGIMEKSGEVNQNILGTGYDVYGKNEWGIQEKTKEYRKNILGDGYDIYEKNQWGIMEKTGEVKKLPQ